MADVPGTAAASGSRTLLAHRIRILRLGPDGAPEHPGLLVVNADTDIVVTIAPNLRMDLDSVRLWTNAPLEEGAFFQRSVYRMLEGSDERNPNGEWQVRVPALLPGAFELFVEFEPFRDGTHIHATAVRAGEPGSEVVRTASGLNRRASPGPRVEAGPSATHRGPVIRFVVPPTLMIERFAQRRRRPGRTRRVHERRTGSSRPGSASTRSSVGPAASERKDRDEADDEADDVEGDGDEDGDDEDRPTVLQPLPLEGICLQTHLTRCLGPIGQWPAMLAETFALGFNFIHFTPVQQLGSSGSSYSIWDQLCLAPSVFEEDPEVSAAVEEAARRLVESVEAGVTSPLARAVRAVRRRMSQRLLTQTELGSPGSWRRGASSAGGAQEGPTEDETVSAADNAAIDAAMDAELADARERPVSALDAPESGTWGASSPAMGTPAQMAATSETSEGSELATPQSGVASHFLSRASSLLRTLFRAAQMGLNVTDDATQVTATATTEMSSTVAPSPSADSARGADGQVHPTILHPAPAHRDAPVAPSGPTSTSAAAPRPALSASSSVTASPYLRAAFQLDLNPHMDPRVEALKMRKLAECVETIERRHGVLSMVDIVLNHTAADSPWLSRHPEAGYSMDNSPHLRPAAVLDQAMLDVSRGIAHRIFCDPAATARAPRDLAALLTLPDGRPSYTAGVAPEMRDAAAVRRATDLVKTLAPQRCRLWEYYVADLDTEESAFFAWVLDALPEEVKACLEREGLAVRRGPEWARARQRSRTRRHRAPGGASRRHHHRHNRSRRRSQPGTGGQPSGGRGRAPPSPEDLDVTEVVDVNAAGVESGEGVDVREEEDQEDQEDDDDGESSGLSGEEVESGGDSRGSKSGKDMDELAEALDVGPLDSPALARAVDGMVAAKKSPSGTPEEGRAPSTSSTTSSESSASHVSPPPSRSRRSSVGVGAAADPETRKLVARWWDRDADAVILDPLWSSASLERGLWAAKWVHQLTAACPADMHAQGGGAGRALREEHLSRIVSRLLESGAVWNDGSGGPFAVHVDPEAAVLVINDSLRELAPRWVVPHTPTNAGSVSSIASTSSPSPSAMSTPSAASCPPSIRWRPPGADFAAPVAIDLDAITTCLVHKARLAAPDLFPLSAAPASASIASYDELASPAPSPSSSSTPPEEGGGGKSPTSAPAPLPPTETIVAALRAMSIFRRVVETINLGLYHQYDEDVGVAMSAVHGTAEHMWLHERRAEETITEEKPLVYSYFVRLETGDTLACNGFIWNGDPEIDFTLPRGACARAFADLVKRGPPMRFQVTEPAEWESVLRRTDSWNHIPTWSGPSPLASGLVPPHGVAPVAPAAASSPSFPATADSAAESASSSPAAASPLTTSPEVTGRKAGSFSRGRDVREPVGTVGSGGGRGMGVHGGLVRSPSGLTGVMGFEGGGFSPPVGVGSPELRVRIPSAASASKLAIDVGMEVGAGRPGHGARGAGAGGEEDEEVVVQENELSVVLGHGGSRRRPSISMIAAPGASPRSGPSDPTQPRGSAPRTPLHSSTMPHFLPRVPSPPHGLSSSRPVAKDLWATEAYLRGVHSLSPFYTNDWSAGAGSSAPSPSSGGGVAFGMTPRGTLPPLHLGEAHQPIAGVPLPALLTPAAALPSYLAALPGAVGEDMSVAAAAAGMSMPVAPGHATPHESLLSGRTSAHRISVLPPTTGRSLQAPPRTDAESSTRGRRRSFGWDRDVHVDASVAMGGPVAGGSSAGGAAGRAASALSERAASRSPVHRPLTGGGGLGMSAAHEGAAPLDTGVTAFPGSSARSSLSGAPVSMPVEPAMRIRSGENVWHVQRRRRRRLVLRGQRLVIPPEIAIPVANASTPFVRRELVIWGDCVKLRYGLTPRDSPWLWSHMTEYVQRMARVFQGVRLDNAHGTPLHVAAAMLDAARAVRPALYVNAELFTGDLTRDVEFVSRLGINSLVREAMQAGDERDLARYVYANGGIAVGSLKPAHPPVCELLPCPLPALFFDCTHDNETPFQKRTIADALPNAALVAAAVCAVGSVRSYDQLVPLNVRVVDDYRFYAPPVVIRDGPWTEGALVAAAQRTIAWDEGLRRVRARLNTLHAFLAVHGFSEIHVHHERVEGGGDVISVTRAHPSSPSTYVIICRTAFRRGAGQHSTLPRLRLEGRVAGVEFAARLDAPDDLAIRTLPPRERDVVRQAQEAARDALDARQARGATPGLASPLRTDAAIPTRDASRAMQASRSGSSAGAPTYHARMDVVNGLEALARVWVVEGSTGGMASWIDPETGQTVTAPTPVPAGRGTESSAVAPITWLQLDGERFTPGSVLVLRLTAPRNAQILLDPLAPTLLSPKSPDSFVPGTAAAAAAVLSRTGATGEVGSAGLQAGAGTLAIPRPPALPRVESLLAASRFGPALVDLEEALLHNPRITLPDLTRLLYRSESEERDDSGGRRGVYGVPGFGSLPWAGVGGLMTLIRQVRKWNDLGHPLCENVRQGPWLMDYLEERIADVPSLIGTRAWMREHFAIVKRMPAGLRPQGFDRVVSAVFHCAVAAAVQRMRYSPLMQRLLFGHDGGSSSHHHHHHHHHHLHQHDDHQEPREHQHHAHGDAVSSASSTRGHADDEGAVREWAASAIDPSGALARSPPQGHPSRRPLRRAISMVIDMNAAVALASLGVQPRHTVSQDVEHHAPVHGGPVAGSHWQVHGRGRDRAEQPALATRGRSGLASEPSQTLSLPTDSESLAVDVVGMEEEVTDEPSARDLLVSGVGQSVVRRGPLGERGTGGGWDLGLPSASAREVPDETEEETTEDEDAEGASPTMETDPLVARERSVRVFAAPGAPLPFVLGLAMTSVQLFSHTRSAPLLAVPLLEAEGPYPNPDEGDEWARTEEQVVAARSQVPTRLHRAVGSLAAGVDHFCTGFMRNWGRDTMIALRGLLLLTGRFAVARRTLLAFATVVRHGLIPNLMDGGQNPRYNARDATWWFLQAVQDYCTLAPEGEEVLRARVHLRFPSDRLEDYAPDPATGLKVFAGTGECVRVRTLGEVVWGILQRHAEGIVFREWNAGSAIDAHMRDEGFNQMIGLDPCTGIVHGGNEWNCGTWMDKMGESERFGTRGVPATPRDGAPIEITGLLYSTLVWAHGVAERGLLPRGAVHFRTRPEVARWIDEVRARGLVGPTADPSTWPASPPSVSELSKGEPTGRYTTAALVRASGSSGGVAEVEWSFAEWAAVLRSSFEREYFVPREASEDARYALDTALVNARGIYKDTRGGVHRWADYQLRPNLTVAMAVAPDLFHPMHAAQALQVVERQLLGSAPGQMGVRTLDPSDWAYRGNYVNSSEDDRATAKGWNYHQGPEWLWPMGYYLRARLRFPPGPSSTNGSVLSDDDESGAAAGAARSPSSGATQPRWSRAAARRWVLSRLSEHAKHLQESVHGGLPELTNANGAICHDSCVVQAWSSATLLDALYDAEALPSLCDDEVAADDE